MNEPNASLDDLTVTVDCTPRILTQGAALRIEAKLSGEAAVLVAALDLFILDEAGNAKVEARGAVRPIRASSATELDRRHYMLDFSISEQVLPGDYKVAVSIPGRRTATLIPISVIDAKTESKLELL
jgi:hypothetical protein